jgi:hypothetical protein
VLQDRHAELLREPRREREALRRTPRDLGEERARRARRVGDESGRGTGAGDAVEETPTRARVHPLAAHLPAAAHLEEQREEQALASVERAGSAAPARGRGRVVGELRRDRRRELVRGQRTALQHFEDEVLDRHRRRRRRRQGASR